MQHSIDRILTTHAGSIPRGEPLGALLIDQEQGKPVDKAKLAELADARVAHVLAKEAEASTPFIRPNGVLAIPTITDSLKLIYLLNY